MGFVTYINNEREFKYMVTEIFNPIHVPDQSTLRDYQKECIEKINRCESGRHLVVLPTGAGKTYVFSHIPRRGRVLILSHRDELVRQPEKYYINEKVYSPDGKELPAATYGIEKAGEHSNGEEIVSASVPSMIRRLDKFDKHDFDMIIIDESHHAVADSYKRILNHFEPRLVIGVTATPDRNDKKDLKSVFEDIIYSRDLRWAIKDAKCLTDIEAYQVNVNYDLRAVKKQMGDFAVQGLGNAMMQPGCVDEVVRAYNEMRRGQTIIFAVNVEHAQLLASKIPGAAVITAETKNRADILKAFSERKIPCLVNCMVLTEGTDLPLVETVIMARPTTNASLYMQMVGRGLRLYPGKKALKLIDCVGVTKIKPVNVGHLFGVNIDMVPEKKKNQLDGVLLTEMENKIEEILDTPEFWISANRVQIFEEENDIDLRNINFVPLADNSLKLSLTNIDIYIPEADALGQTAPYITKSKEKVIRGQMKLMDYQEAIDQVANYLLRKHADEEKLWNVEYVKNYRKTGKLHHETS